MKNGLLELNELVGVWGSILCTKQGDLIESSPPTGFTESTLEDISKLAIELLSSAEKSITGVREAVIHYSERKIFVLDLEQAIVVVFCTPSVDISLLRMTVNVITTRWQSDKKIQKKLKEAAVKRM
jgi:predicted regulator of Ras-like GTPase activity (Roadblock/LC7/MglB family)